MPKQDKNNCIFVLSITLFIIGCHGDENVLSMEIADAPELTSKTFLVKCRGRCRDINATVKVDAGDPDIFASENQPPKVGNIFHYLG